MCAKHGDGWEAIVAKLDNAKRQAKPFKILEGTTRPNVTNLGITVTRKKKQRWSQQQKDEHAFWKEEKREQKEAKRAKERAQGRERERKQDRAWKGFDKSFSVQKSPPPVT